MFIYSSERFIPPLYATLPSITIIFLWSRLLSCDFIKRNGLKGTHFIPFSPSFKASAREYVAILPRSSYIILTSTPCAAFLAIISTTVLRNLPFCKIKYSAKMYFSAFSSSLHISANISSPTEKYSALSSFTIGKPVASLILFTD